MPEAKPYREVRVSGEFIINLLRHPENSWGVWVVDKPIPETAQVIAMKIDTYRPETIRILVESEEFEPVEPIVHSDGLEYPELCPVYQKKERNGV